MADTLTIETAKAYVRAYYAKCDGCSDVTISNPLYLAKGEHSPGMPATVLLHAHYVDWRGNSQTDGWDVWIEDGHIYGEC